MSRLPSHVHEELKTQGVRPVAIGAKTTLLERLKGPFSGLHFPAIDAIPGSIQIRHDVGLGIRGESSKGVLEHEVGHALDVNSEALAIANLNSHSSRFRSICVKYNAGTKGGGGGMGGTTDEYYKYKWKDWIIGACTELYAQLYSEFMNDPVGLRFRDPQAFQFFNEVDGVLRHAHEPPGPPLTERPGPFSGPNPQITRPVPKMNPVTVGIWGDGI